MRGSAADVTGASRPPSSTPDSVASRSMAQRGSRTSASIATNVRHDERDAQRHEPTSRTVTRQTGRDTTHRHLPTSPTVIRSRRSHRTQRDANTRSISRSASPSVSRTCVRPSAARNSRSATRGAPAATAPAVGMGEAYGAPSVARQIRRGPHFRTQSDVTACQVEPGGLRFAPAPPITVSYSVTERDRLCVREQRPAKARYDAE